jgi:DNA-binding response OmpR family regulator
VRVLCHAGYKAVGVHSAEAALRLAAQEQFDLVVSDISMPGKNGWELMRELGTGGMPGIAVSAHGNPQDLVRSLQAGFARHLCKPLNIDELLAAVKDVFEAR